jgi:hypothetical protein
LSVYTPATPAKARKRGSSATASCYWSGAEADAEAEQGQVCQPVVGEQRGGRVLDVLDVGFGVLNCRGSPSLSPKYRKSNASAACPRSAIAWAYAGRLLLHRGERTNRYDHSAGALPSGRNRLPTNVSSSLLNVNRVFVAVSILLGSFLVGC